MTESDCSIRVLPAQAERVESGPLQFGDDWPGVFIRGDEAGFMALTLQMFLDGDLDLKEEVFSRMLLVDLQRRLASAIVGPARDVVTR